VEDRLRICLIAFMFAPMIGGAETRAEKLAHQLQELGHQVTIITLRHEKRWQRTENINGLSVVRIGGIYSRKGTLHIGRLGHFSIDILLFLMLWRLRHRYDIIYSLQMSPLAVVAVIFGKITHKPTVISIPSTGPGKMLRPEDATLMADTLTDTSFLKVAYNDIMLGDIADLSQTALGGQTMIHFLKQSDAFYQIMSSRSYPYLTSHGFRPEKIFLIPNGVDIEKFHPDPRSRPDPTRPERDILCVARLQYPKGVDVLLHAWARMMKGSAAWRTRLKPRLLLAGTGPLQQQLEQLATALGIHDSVVFLGLRTDVVLLLQQCWSFVLPSRWEGMPNALLEAMACGIPCIATRVSGSEDIIADGINGLLVEPEQPAEMAQALRRMIEDAELAQKLAQEGYATVQRDYQLIHVTRQCVDLYRHALAKDQTAFIASNSTYMKGREYEQQAIHCRRPERTHDEAGSYKRDRGVGRLE